MIRSVALILLGCIVSSATFAQTVTVTASTLTMEQGLPVPPLVWVQSTYPTTCTGAPALSTTATSGSSVGTYTITATAGTYACTGYTISTVNGTMNVIAADGKGAQINNAIVYPPGFTSSAATQPALNVTSNSTCNMVGDGVTDNTSCFNTLLGPGRSYLYFPAGVYLVSGQISPPYNSWNLRGVGPQQSVIRLAPNSAAFNTGTNTPWFNPTSIGGNENFYEFITGIGFDVGYGNPNAIPMTLAMNNIGALRDVIIWSEDSNCPYALSFHLQYPGPALSKNLAIYGCQEAISSNQIEYNWVFDELTTEGQTGRIVDSGPAHFQFQHWLSDGSMSSGQALETGQYGTIDILDSSLLNGSGTGIINVPGASVFVRNTTVTGYSPSEADSGTGTTVNYTGNLTQNWTGAATSTFNANLTPSSLYLPEQETPLPTDDPTPSNWTALTGNPSTWCAQITGSASVTVYLPPANGYSGSSTTYSCSIPDTVNHLNFYNSQIAGSQFNFTIAGSSSTPLVIDGCPRYSTCTVTHSGTRTVVIRDASLKAYAASAGAGNVFFEDDANGVGTLQASQSVWGRQFDIEFNSQPQLPCAGCTLWVLGFKTENAYPDLAPSLVLTAGARAEIFGSFWYPLSASAGGTAPIYSTNSQLFAAPIFSFENIADYGWQYWIQETKGLATASIPGPYPAAGNYILNMYYSTTGSASVYPSVSAGVTLK